MATGLSATSPSHAWPCQTWLEDSSFVLCDANARGFPIRYVSRGFEQLYGYSSSECVGQQCGGLVGGAAVLAAEACAEGGAAGSPLNAVAAGSGLSREEVLQGVGLLTSFASSEVKRVFAAALGTAAKDSTESAAASVCAVLLNRRKCGSFFVCEMVAFPRRHPVLGWSYGIGIQRDISTDITVGELLNAAVSGSYGALLAQRRVSFYQRLLEIGDADVGKYLDERAGQMWQALVAVADPEKKSSKRRGSGACSLASRSTSASGTSSRSGISVSTNDSFETTGGFDRSCREERMHPVAEYGFSGLLHQQLAAGLHIGSVVLDCGSQVRIEEEADLDHVEDSQGRFFDILEAVEGVTSASDAKRPQVEDAMPDHAKSPKLRGYLHNAPPLEVMDGFCRKEVCDLDFALTLSDPCLPGCPVLACSAGFTDLIGYGMSEVVGQDTRKLVLRGVPRDLVNTTAEEELEAFCEAAASGEQYSARAVINQSSVCKESVNPEEFGFRVLRNLVEGELLCLQAGARKSGSLFRSMHYWKQIQLDDQPIILCIQARLLDPVIDPEECDREEGHTNIQIRCEELWQQLSGFMDVTEQVLTSQFWYSAPMRRQIASQSEDVSDIDDFYKKFNI